MSVQYPTIPTPTAAQGIDATIVDLQTHLSFELSWLTNGMGRAYKVKKVRTNGVTQFLPMVYLGTNKYNYFDASPDNDKQGQSIILVGDSSYINYQRGFYGVLEYPVSFIFSANLETINNTLLDTEIYTEHLISDVRAALTRDLLGKPYNLVIDTDTQNFETVYSEFDINTDTGKTNKPLVPMVYFRFDTTIQIKESCPITPLNRCLAIQNNLTQDDINTCIIPNFCTQPNTFSMLFDGVSESISTKIQAAAYDLERTDLFSFSIWIKPTTLVEAHIVNKFVVVGGSGKGYFIRTTTTGQIRFVLANDTGVGNSIDIRTPTGLINSGVWQNVIVTYDGSSTAAGCKIYINSILQPNTVFIDNLTSSILQPLVLLNFGGGNSRFFNGNIDEVLAYNIALTQSNVNDIYANGTPPKDPLLSSSLFVHCRMGEGSLFGINNRHFPDSTNNTTSYISVNMEEVDMVTDVP